MAMRMNEKKIILVCTLGKSPQVLVETVWALANQEKWIVPDEIVAISMNNFARDVKDSIFGKGKGWSLLIDKLRKVGISVAGKFRFEDITIANDDQMLQKVYLKMPITIALGAVLEQKGFEHSGIYVASFKHFSPLLSRLNEIDSGKYKYSRLLPKYNSQKNNMRSSNVVVTVVVK